MKQSKTKIGLLLLVGVMLCGLLVACGSQSTTTVKLNDYITIEGEGYEGYGTVSYTFDDSSFVNDYAEKIAYKPDENGSDEKPSASVAEAFADSMTDCGHFTVEDGLSNGEETIFTWDIDADSLEEIYAVKLDYSDITYKVEGLSDLEQADVLNGGELNGNAFEGITVNFSGTSPQGTASVDTSGSIDGVTASMFTLSKSSWIANGETVTVSITDDGKAQLAEKCGIIPTETEKEFTAEGLPYYVSDISEIPEDSFKTAWTRIEDTYTEEVRIDLENSKSAWGHQLREFISMDYDGYYFFVNEETGSNSLIFVYNINAFRSSVSDRDTNLDVPVNYYWFAYYDDIIIDTDGTWIVSSEYQSMTELLGEDNATFTLESEYAVLGILYTEDETYVGYQYENEMLKDIENALGEYTLVDNTVQET